MKRFFLLASLLITLWVSASPELCYIDNNGLIKAPLADIFATLGVDLEHYRDPGSNLPTNHIFHAYRFLEIFYCPKPDLTYQETQAFYRRGGMPVYMLSQEQVTSLLRVARGRFALHKNHDPEVNKPADVVIFSGADWSLKKRLFSLKAFLTAGFTCNALYFLSRTEELHNNVKRLLKEEKEFFEGEIVLPLYVPYKGNPRGSTHEDFVIALAQTISQEFYLISDPEYAGILLDGLNEFGKRYGITCLGEFIRPITTDPDEYVELDRKGYHADNPDRLTPIKESYAMAYATLCQLGHQVAKEIALFAPEYKR